jgi:hypothetical protein
LGALGTHRERLSIPFGAGFAHVGRSVAGADAHTPPTRPLGVGEQVLM